MQYHYRMAFDEHGRSMFYVFKNCKEFIRTVPNLVYDEKDVEDVDTKQEDHIYDECRYVLMSRIIAIRKHREKPLPLEDPLDLYKEERERRSRVIRV